MTDSVASIGSNDKSEQHDSERFSGISNLEKINRLLVVLLAVVVILLVLSVAKEMAKLNGVDSYIEKMQAKAETVSSKAPLSAIPSEALPDIDLSLDNRNVFQAVRIDKNIAAGPVQPTLASSFRLVGISQATSTQDTVVMVEDKRSRVTHFLQTGKTVEGIELKRILDDRVTISVGGETIELQ